MDFVQIAISARLAHGDLVAADQALESDPSDRGVRLILVKQLFLSCANVADIELIGRGLYREHPEIGEIITPHTRNFEFAKYIRNIAVGHVNPTLSRKAIEWRPELNAVLAVPKPGGDAFLAFAILETAINTFVDGDSHRIFESDTDLGYRPDLIRFLNFLGSTVHVGIAYCEALASAAVRRAELPDFDANWVSLRSKLERWILSSLPGRVSAAAARSPWNISPTFSSKRTKTDAVRSPDLMGLANHAYSRSNFVSTDEKLSIFDHDNAKSPARPGQPGRIPVVDSMRRRRMLADWMDQNFAGRSRPEQGHAVGNAVPPLMAKVIGRAYVERAVALARGRRQSLKLGKSGVSTNSAVIRAS